MSSSVYKGYEHEADAASDRPTAVEVCHAPGVQQHLSYFLMREKSLLARKIHATTFKVVIEAHGDRVS